MQLLWFISLHLFPTGNSSNCAQVLLPLQHGQVNTHRTWHIQYFSRQKRIYWFIHLVWGAFETHMTYFLYCPWTPYNATHQSNSWMPPRAMHLDEHPHTKANDKSSYNKKYQISRKSHKIYWCQDAANKMQDTAAREMWEVCNIVAAGWWKHGHSFVFETIDCVWWVFRTITHLSIVT